MPPVGFEPKISAGERPQAAHLASGHLGRDIVQVGQRFLNFQKVSIAFIFKGEANQDEWIVIVLGMVKLFLSFDSLTPKDEKYVLSKRRESLTQ